MDQLREIFAERLDPKKDEKEESDEEEPNTPKPWDYDNVDTHKIDDLIDDLAGFIAERKGQLCKESEQNLKSYILDVINEFQRERKADEDKAFTD
jgi:hypothetical protein